MAEVLCQQAVNTNALVFEELATSLASLMAYMASFQKTGSGMSKPVEDFQHLYESALKHPPCYRDVNELTGQSMNAGDRRSGQGAWLLMNVEKLQVYGVHSLLWHKVNKLYTAPLLDQVARAIGEPSLLMPEDLQHLGDEEGSLIDILGTKGNSIWLVQTLWEKKIVDSAVTPSRFGSRALFKSRVFKDPVLDGNALKTLHGAAYVMRRAFPSAKVGTFCLVLHPSKPDFELYGFELGKVCPTSVVLTDDMVRNHSLRYETQIQEDHESLLMLPQRLDDELFRGLPPCRGGRTLGMLAATATRQLNAENLVTWKERDCMDMLKQDFNYEIPRDKVRHDLVDRLVGQGFMRKWTSDYHLTMKGIARYLYCLAKYTTKASADSMDVLEACSAQRNRIMERYGCI